MNDEVKPGQRREIVGWVGAGVIALGLLAFVLQNGRRTPVDWLLWDVKLPLWLLVVVSAVAGAVLARVIGWLVRRRRRS